MMKGMNEIMSMTKRQINWMYELIAKVLLIFGLLQAFMMTTTLDVFASAPDQVIQPINLLVELFAALVVAMGGYWLVKGIYEWSVAHQSSDVSGQNVALKGIVSGILCVSVSIVLAYLGFTI